MFNLFSMYESLFLILSFSSDFTAITISLRETISNKSFSVCYEQIKNK